MGDEKTKKIVVHGNSRAGFEITYNGVYDFEELLGTVQGWLDAYKYDHILKEHSEKVGPDGKEIKANLKGVRKVSDYVKFDVDVLVLILREVDVAVMYKGKQVKQQKGELVVQIRTVMEKNWNQTFGPKQEFLRQNYEKYIMKKTLESYKDKLRKEGEALITLIKQHFAQNW